MNNKSGIWVTGASSGLGRAIAKEFASVGCNVFATARRSAELERLKDEVEDHSDNIHVFPCNVASSANVDQTVKKITKEFEINCLVNNAGITSFKTAEKNSVNEINDVINTNLLGAVYATKAVLPKFIKKNEGTIINILSVVVNKIYKNSSAYTASKMGLLGYSQVLREEVRDKNIRVININPGATDTPIWEQEVRNEYAEKMLQPESIARLVVSVFLQKDNLVTEEIVVRPVTGDLS